MQDSLKPMLSVTRFDIVNIFKLIYTVPKVKWLELMTSNLVGLIPSFGSLLMWKNGVQYWFFSGKMAK